MSISQNFPEEGPTLNLNFAGSRTLDPRITFSRSQTTSNGSTYMDQNGLIRYAGPDEPRFDHRYVNGEIESLGLLIEEQRTNTVRNSEDLTILSARWNEVADGVTVTTNQAVAPDGNTTADKVAIKTSGSGSKAIQSSILTGTSSGTAITSSIFCKAAEHNYVYVEMQGGGNTGGIVVDLSDGSLITEISAPDSYKIEPYPNDWYRISATSTTASTAATALRIYLTDASGNAGWTGTIGDGVYMWGGQHEVGAFPTSYIPTDDTFGGKTRNQDRTLIDGERFTEWYNPTEGTFFCTVNDPKGIVVFGVGDTFENTIYTTAGGAFSAAIRSGNAGISLVGEISRVGTSKVALAVKTDNSSLCINGAITGSSLTADMPLSTLRLTIGASSWSPTAGDNQVGGTISQLIYYPTRLTNAQLQNLTK